MSTRSIFVDSQRENQKRAIHHMGESRSALYRKHAEECRRLSTLALHQDLREQYFDLAATYEQLAEQMETIEQTQRRIHTSRSGARRARRSTG